MLELRNRTGEGGDAMLGPNRVFEKIESLIPFKHRVLVNGF